MTLNGSNVSQDTNSTSSSPFAALAALKPVQGDTPVEVVVSEQVSEVPTGEAVIEAKPAKQWVLVTHLNQRSACTDSLLCIWFMIRYMLKGTVPLIRFVRSGERLPKDEEDGYVAEGCEVVHLDTGGGDCDQHGKKLARSSSFALTVEKYRKHNEPALQVLIELSKKSDNVEVIDQTSIHYLLRGLPHHFRHPVTKEVDWEGVINLASTILDLQSSRDNIVETNRRGYVRRGSPAVELESGIKVANVGRNAMWREAAFAAGADVVMWTVPVNKHEPNGPFNVGIQNNRVPKRALNALVEHLRYMELNKRKVKGAFAKMDCDGKHPQVPGWFLHDSNNFIGCGTDTHPLEAHEHTTLTPDEIFGGVKLILGQKEKAA